MKPSLQATVLGAAICAASAVIPSAALACGGFFCNQSQPVNQAAEGIIFADNGDGTITAVIQIQYQGPSKSFSWLLPIASVPKSDADIGIASNIAFQRLQSATNPNYTLTTRVEGTCRQQSFNSTAPVPGGSRGSNQINIVPAGSDVKVEASGVVGAFEWTVISVVKSTPSPADAAVTWLTENGYDVPSGAPALLGPYLEQGLNLLALRLTKGADSGSIRPIVLTYTGTQPSIPIKLTAVAANEDMGVLTWVLGQARSAPANYLSLELNEARINWFNANSNYNSVVIEAANDAGGQGFVTEFAGTSATLAAQIWTANDALNWNSFKSRVYQSFGEFFQQAYKLYGAWDGFWDATRTAVTLPAGLAFEDFKLCPNCYADKIQVSPAAYLAELEKSVVAPVQLVQNVVDAHPQLTRMYTTLSPDEMTLDPLFLFNADLPAVSNQHSAERIIECNSMVYDYEAPWRIELPQGGVVRGSAAAAQAQTWPASLGSLPSTRLIVQSGATGGGRVVEDNSGAINSMLATYNAAQPGGAVSDGGCSLARGTTNGGRPLGALLAAVALGAVVIRRRRRS